MSRLHIAVWATFTLVTAPASAQNGSVTNNTGQSSNGSDSSIPSRAQGAPMIGHSDSETRVAPDGTHFDRHCDTYVKPRPVRGVESAGNANSSAEGNA